MADKKRRPQKDNNELRLSKEQAEAPASLDEETGLSMAEAEDEVQSSEESLDLIQYEHSLEKLEGQDEDVDAELNTDSNDVYNTKYSDGHTYNPHIAWEQGLTYTPPTDPPIRPSDDLEGAEIAAGFAPSMESTDPDVEDLPAEVDNNDLDLLDDIYTALHNNSETGHLTNINVQVDEGVVSLWGTVQTEDDIPIVYDIISDLEGVVAVEDHLEVEE